GLIWDQPAQAVLNMCLNKQLAMSRSGSNFIKYWLILVQPRKKSPKWLHVSMHRNQFNIELLIYWKSRWQDWIRKRMLDVSGRACPNMRWNVPSVKCTDLKR